MSGGRNGFQRWEGSHWSGDEPRSVPSGSAGAVISSLASAAMIGPGQVSEVASWVRGALFVLWFVSGSGGVHYE
jgi:hypothetical protein